VREVAGCDEIPLSGVLSRACRRVVYFEWSETVLVIESRSQGVFEQLTCVLVKVLICGGLVFIP